MSISEGVTVEDTNEVSQNVVPLTLQQPKRAYTPSTVWAFEVDHVNPWAYWETAFSDAECDTIIEIGESLKPQTATVGSGQVTPEIRISDTSWIFPSMETDWLFRRMTDIIMSLNERFFKFNLYGLTEGLQFTKYGNVGSYYGKHQDSMYGTRIRKLSFSLQLSDPSTYEGGDLLIYCDNPPTPMRRDRGSVSLFPSYTLHEVTPVTSGVRYSLVAWVTGRPFK